MIGWWIIVSTQTPEERDQADQDTRRAAILAQWEAGAEGIRWVEQLAEQGKAAKLSGGGYPNRYTAQARDVLPLLGVEPSIKKIDVEKVAGAIEADAGEALPDLRQALAEANAGLVQPDAGVFIIGDDYVMPSNWRGKIELHTDRMAACPAGQVLTIDAWDQS